MDGMKVTIRNIREDESELLKDFLYEAIFVPEGAEPPPKDIITKPELQVYVRDFGCEKGDYAYGAFRQHRTTIVCQIRSQIFRQIA